ncbi:hypothetical protein GOP47_0010706 [Adiantum capillus-veneris]|uniref:Uncharacterized protein n=1 Tax=Adiantum capillus-veneris TaxID=13818 RepID=A0A9D4UV19_ADICA|nr:hypothetical protein GOP47_0010706 [Adiantum capillus-veneris]
MSIKEPLGKEIEGREEAVLGGWFTSFDTACAADIDKMCATNIASLGTYMLPNVTDGRRAAAALKLMQWHTIVDIAYEQSRQ